MKKKLIAAGFGGRMVVGRTEWQPKAKHNCSVEYSYLTYSSNTSLRLEYNLNRTHTVP